MARVAMADGHVQNAQECVARALATMDGFELPLAIWRVHATAAALGELRGDTELAERHRELSRAMIVRIANSLPSEDSLRMTLLSAVPVTGILA